MKLKKVVNKKGSVLTDNLIWIILGLLLLVLLLWFTIPQFRDIMSKIFGFATDNKDTVTQNCNIQCSTLQKNAYCCVTKTLKIEGQADRTGNCKDWKIDGTLPNINCDPNFCEGTTC
ncbi:hypothetical protein HZA33_01660 [Candidatus Pacearchaeota archaeon]|nr:hypothetical protein [Candidatus Pacearchaeota archaeon]